MLAVERVREHRDLRTLVARYAVELPGMEAQKRGLASHAVTSRWLGLHAVCRGVRVSITRDQLVAFVQRAAPHALKNMRARMLTDLELTWGDMAYVPLVNIRAIARTHGAELAERLFPVQRGPLLGFYFSRMSSDIFEWCLRLALPTRMDQFIERACCTVGTPTFVLAAALKWCLPRLEVDPDTYRELIQWGVREDNAEFATWAVEKAREADVAIRPLDPTALHWVGCECVNYGFRRTRLLKWALRRFGLMLDFLARPVWGNSAPRVHQWVARVSANGKVTRERGYDVVRI